MKIIIAGGRDITNQPEIRTGILSSDWLGSATEIIHGGCPTGVDAYVATEFEGLLPVRVFPADWQAPCLPSCNHGGRKMIRGRSICPAAGPIRNAAMADYGDVLILIWDGMSRGSASMLRAMDRLGKPVHQHIVRG